MHRPQPGQEPLLLALLLFQNLDPREEHLRLEPLHVQIRPQDLLWPHYLIASSVPIGSRLNAPMPSMNAALSPSFPAHSRALSAVSSGRPYSPGSENRGPPPAASSSSARRQ